MSDILEPDDNGTGHSIHVNAMTLACTCGWSYDVTDDVFVESVKLRHLRTVGAIGDKELDDMPYVNNKDLDDEYENEDAPNKITEEEAAKMDEEEDS